MIVLSVTPLFDRLQLDSHRFSQYDLLALAFQGDITRVSTILYARDLPPGGQNPRKRRELFGHYAPLVRAALTTNQYPAYDRMVEEYQKKSERRTR